MSLVLPPDSVEIGGARQLYSLGLLPASLCAVPLLLLLAAVGSLGAARFGAPTAIVFAAFLFLLFVGRDSEERQPGDFVPAPSPRSPP